MRAVTCFLRAGGDVLLTRRADSLADGRCWAALSREVGDGADAGAVAERLVASTVGSASAPLVREGDPVDTPGRRRHPFLFETPTRDVEPPGDGDTAWVQPTAIRDREAAPGLWAAYRAVAPTPATIRDDREHGSAWLSIRALEAVRDRAATAHRAAAITAVARDLRAARPGMAAIANRVDRVMAGGDRAPAAVRERAETAVERAVAAADAAAAATADLLPRSVATLSRSGTVGAALRAARPAVVVGESCPAREGVGVAESLAADGLDVTVTVDAALPGIVAGEAPASVDAAGVLFGADAVLPDGSAVNKVGSYPLALAAARAGRPVYVAAARDKVRPDAAVHGESGSPDAVYDGDGDLGVASPLFERVPADLLTAVVTEDGPLDADGVAAVADEHRHNAAWVDDGA